MYNFVNKLRLSRQLLFEEGQVKLLGKPALMLIPADCFIELQEELANDGGIRVYNAGKKAGQDFFTLVSHYAIDPMNALKFGVQIFNISGFGKLNVVDVNLKNKRALYRIENCLSKERRSGEPKCHFVRGILCGFTQRILQEDVECVETHCAAMGSEVCEFIVKRSEDFDRDKEIVKKQLETRD